MNSVQGAQNENQYPRQWLWVTQEHSQALPKKDIGEGEGE